MALTNTPDATAPDSRSARRPLGFALSGGSASGAVQVGMLLALAEVGIRPDLIVGTSVGALNGVLVAADPTDNGEKLAEIWLNLERGDVLGSNRSLRTWSCLVRTRRHLFEADALASFLTSNLPVDSFEELAIPLAAVATRACTGETELLQRGSLTQALLASAAIPGAFPQVEIDGELYFDGGVTANVPVRQAFDLGAATVIVLDSGPEPTSYEPSTNIAGTIQYAVGLMMRSQTSNLLPQLGTEHRVIRLPLATPPGVGVFDFDRTPELIERGHAATADFLANRGREEIGRAQIAPTVSG